MNEETRVLVFVVVVFSIFLLAAFFIMRNAYRRLRRMEDRDSAPIRWLSRGVIAVAAFGAGCVLYGFFVEPYWPQVTHVQVSSQKVKAPIRIVHISDLHSDPKSRLEPELPSLIASQGPDFIVYTGDSLNSDDAAPVFLRFLHELTQVAPVYVARGNWDIGLSNDFFTGTGAHVVDGQPLVAEVKGQRIYLIGVRVGNEPSIAPMLAAVPADGFVLFLHHWPDEIMDVARTRKVDLYCAGHTHGGQVALPGYGALITLSRFGKRFESGLYRVEDTWLYVNRGIGMEGGAAFRVRFWARPEITVIDVVPPS